MTTPTALSLAEMPLPEAAAYAFRLQHMQDLLGRHRRWRTCLRTGLLLALLGGAYGIASDMLALTLLALSVAALIPGLLLILPARLQDQYQRDIATLLRDLPPASDSQPPTLREISHLLQSPRGFECILGDWLRQEIARCESHEALAVAQCLKQQ